MLAFIINAGINFKLTPYIIDRLGTEAYGFIGLAFDFVNYAGILTLALNTMTGRFISVEYHRGNKKKAQTYINSILISNLFLSGILCVVAIFLIWKLEYVVNIPPELTTDVKITFSLVFINYILGICISVLNCAAYVKNRVDKTYVRNAISYILKLIITIALITAFDIKIFFISLTSVICTVYMGVASYIITKKLMPEIHFSLRDFSWEAVKNILSGGIWMSILSLSNLLLSGLNSFLANKLISVISTGYLSAAKTIPRYINMLSEQLSQTFSPRFTQLFSRGESDQLITELKKSINIVSFILTVPIAGFIAFGSNFYALWLENYTPDEIALVQTLSVIITLPYLLNAYVYPLIQVNFALNKVKTPAIVTLIIGFINILIVLPFGFSGKLTLITLNVFGSVLTVLRLIFFQPFYTAKLLNIKVSVFFKSIFRNCVVFGVVYIFFSCFKSFFRMESWFGFIFAIGVSGLIGYAISFLLLFDKNEFRSTISLIKSKIKR